MSKSTLPELFKNDINIIKYHPQERPKKIGGRFSIQLNNNHQLNQLPDKIPNKLSQLQINKGFTRSIYDGIDNRYRSQSIQNIQLGLNQPILKNTMTGTRKSACLEQSLLINQMKRSQSFLTKDTPTLQQIYSQNMIRNKTKSTIQYNYGFPYETSRSMNNMKIEMQEAESLNNRVQNLVSEQKALDKVMTELNKETGMIKQHLEQIRQVYFEDLQTFSGDFKLLCQDFMKNLSKMRRETGEQTKSNAFDAEKLYNNYNDIGSIFSLLQQRSNLLRSDCLSTEQLIRTNTKTYAEACQQKLYQGEKLCQLDKLFRKTRRSGTSHDKRQRMSSMQLKKPTNLRVQSSSCRRADVYSQQQNKFQNFLLSKPDAKKKQQIINDLEQQRKYQQDNQINLMNFNEVYFEDY